MVHFGNIWHGKDTVRPRENDAFQNSGTDPLTRYVWCRKAATKNVFHIWSFIFLGNILICFVFYVFFVCFLSVYYWSYFLFLTLFLAQYKVSSMPWSFPRSTPEISQTPDGCRGDPRVYSSLRQHRQSPDPSAALVIPTRIKSASTTATWISSGSTLPSKTRFVKHYKLSWCPQ